MAVLLLAAGLGTGSLTDAADLTPAYRNAMLICAGLMLAGGVLAAALVPTRLGPPRATPAASPVTSYCAVDGPPVPRLP